MSLVKLPYYPKLVVTVKESPFGVQEISNPTVYEKRLENNKVIMRVDLMETLRETLGDECFLNRDMLYKLLSGNGNTEKLLLSHYRKYSSFRRIINESFYYIDDELPVGDRVLKSLRDKVTSWEGIVMKDLYNAGGKYLVTTHWKTYFCFPVGVSINMLKGSILIC